MEIFEFLNGLPAIQSCFKNATDLRITCQFLSKIKMHRPFNPATSLCPIDIHTIMSPRCIKKILLAMLLVTIK